MEIKITSPGIDIPGCFKRVERGLKIAIALTPAIGAILCSLVINFNNPRDSGDNVPQIPTPITLRTDGMPTATPLPTALPILNDSN